MALMRLWLVAVVAVALAVRLAAVAATPDYLPRHDDRDYDRIGWSMSAGRGYPPLRLGGHAVCQAHDGPAALREARTFRPEVVVLDIGLPGMDGYEVARCLRAEPLTRDAVLVAVTGYGRDEDLNRSREGGIDHTLLTSLVDRRGALRVQYLGYRFDPDEFRRDLVSLANEP